MPTMHALQAVILHALNVVRIGSVAGVRAPEGYHHSPQFGQTMPSSVPLLLGRKFHIWLANNMPTPRQEV